MGFTPGVTVSYLIGRNAGWSAYPLTWCHLEILAQLGIRQRSVFLERVLSESLSVRKLREAILREESAADTGSAEAEAGTDSAGVAGIVKLTAHLETVASERTKWEKALADIPDEAGSPDLIKTLEHARDVQTRLRDACSALLSRVQAVLERSNSKRPRLVPPTPAAEGPLATAAQ